MLNLAPIEVFDDTGIAFDKRVYTQAASVFVPRLSRERVGRACVKREAHKLILGDAMPIIFPMRATEWTKWPTNSRTTPREMGL